MCTDLLEANMYLIKKSCDTWIYIKEGMVVLCGDNFIFFVLEWCDGFLVRRQQVEAMATSAVFFSISWVVSTTSLIFDTVSALNKG